MSVANAENTVRQKIALLKEMNRNLDRDIGDLDSLLETVESNRMLVMQLQKLDAMLTQYTGPTKVPLEQSRESEELLKRTIQKQRLLLEEISRKRTSAVSAFEELSKRSMVEKNYVGIRPEPTFVDKDFL